MMKPQSSLKKSSGKASAERVVKGILRQTRRHFSAEDKIRIVLVGLCGEVYECWSMPRRDYRWFEGRSVPTAGETVDHDPEGPLAYGRFKVRELRYGD